MRRKVTVTTADVACVVGTGYGRTQVPFATTNVSEITCHGRGAHHLHSSVRTVIDIGGQDSKGIAIGPSGKVLDFVMNDKCAAGTGRFLEVMAGAVEIDLPQMSDYSRFEGDPVPISSVCTVFAESEVISLISKGARRADIIAGIHESIGARVISMAKRVGMVAPVMMTGGAGVAGGKGGGCTTGRFSTLAVVTYWPDTQPCPLAASGTLMTHQPPSGLTPMASAVWPSCNTPTLG